jgi:uncharacterized OB-fold protein
MGEAEHRPNRTLGGVHDEFWAYCAQHQLRVQECASCGTLAWPPVEVCEGCEGTGLQWKQLSGRGRLVSWCTFHQPYYPNLPLPWDTILVELDEGPFFISNPHGFDNASAASGMPVQVAFLDCEDEAGPFQLPVFERP